MWCDTSVIKRIKLPAIRMLLALPRAIFFSKFKKKVVSDLSLVGITMYSISFLCSIVKITKKAKFYSAIMSKKNTTRPDGLAYSTNKDFFNDFPEEESAKTRR